MHPFLVVTTGEPAGIGPDICLRIASEPLDARLAFVGNAALMAERAQDLGLELEILTCASPADIQPQRAPVMQVLDRTLYSPVSSGRPDPLNARYVLDMLRSAAELCLSGQCDALVTAPVQKSVINEAGIPFSGHTEFLAQVAQAELAVMLLAGPSMRVALTTTHLPLRQVPDALTAARITATLRVLHAGLRQHFGIDDPRIAVLGLNPHAGENGVLGSEERELIAPAVDRLKGEGMRLTGPLPADTAFTAEALATCDAVLAMYHDQGLPAIKATAFGEVVNVTLGLPFIRTSVDHGTALDLAGTGRARSDSLRSAIDLALQIARPAGRVA
jgi:4-hydroxythreonine-4-phosphate dehydrogenase